MPRKVRRGLHGSLDIIHQEAANERTATTFVRADMRNKIMYEKQGVPPSTRIKKKNRIELHA